MSGTTLLVVGIVLVVIFIMIQVMINIDRSKQASLDRMRAKDSTKKVLSEKVFSPVTDFIESKVPEEKKKNKEKRFKQAGFRISYASNLLLCFFVGLVLFLIVTFGIKNVYMGIVFFGIGWNIPSLVIGFVTNKRITKLETQVGMFMRMVTKRYQVIGDFYGAFTSTIEDFAGENPMYDELVITRSDIEHGAAISDALHDLAERVDNKHMRRFADYYEITADIGTEEAKREVLENALQQYKEHIELTRELKKQLSELSMEAYIMLAFVPCVVIYQIIQDPNYIPFMTTTTMGKIGSAIIAAVWLLCFWVINSKIGAPLEKDE